MKKERDREMGLRKSARERVFVCVSEWARECARARERDTDMEKENEREMVCACVCMRDRGTEREIEGQREKD